MISDPARLMQSQGIDILWVAGSSSSTPEMYYLTGGAQLTQGWVILSLNESGELEKTLIHNPMEREQASASGLATLTFGEIGGNELKKKYPDLLDYYFAMFSKLVSQKRLSGRLVFHGCMDPTISYMLLDRMNRELEGISVVRDEPQILELARVYKDDAELEKLKNTANRALQAMTAVFEHIRAGTLKETILTGSHGPITVGDLRRILRLRLAELGLYEEHETIIGMGREAGIPHASSPDDIPLESGKTIVFDLFPRQNGGGYFFDITRTFAIGRMSEQARQIYDNVQEAHDIALENIESGMNAGMLQALVCDKFEERGHPTIRSHPGTSEGYVHNLGHGVGIEVHEYPYLRLQDTVDPRNIIGPGSVFTVEPGLYYPDREIGVRIEDIVYLDNDGKMNLLAPYDTSPVIIPEG
jgi:Xaa-Pro aminopeptidase